MTPLTFERSGRGADPWAALAPHRSGWCALWSTPRAIQFETADGETFTREVPTDFLRYDDATGDGEEEVVGIGVGADNHAYLVRLSDPSAQDLGVVSGNFPVAVAWFEGLWIALCVPDVTGRTCRMVNVIGPTGEVQEIPVPFPEGTSQGIRQYFGGSAIVWGDHTHVVRVAGRTVHKFSEFRAEGIVAGQRDGADHIDLLWLGEWVTPIRGSAQPPRLTRLGDGRIGVAAGTNHGASFAIGPPWPAFIPDVVDPPPPPPPPEDTMEIPREVYDIWLAVALKFADLHKGSDDDRRLATRRGLATIRRRLSSLDRRRWVCKSEHNTGWDAQSKDAIGYVIDDGTINTGDARRMFMFDMMNGTTRTTNPFPIVARNVEEGNPDAFVLIPVEEDDRDWLEDDQPPPPPPPPPGDLPVRVTKLEADLTFVRESLALLLEERVKDKQKLADLEDKITRLPVAEVKKGDPITVKGKLNLRDVLSGGEIISRGTI